MVNIESRFIIVSVAIADSFYTEIILSDFSFQSLPFPAITLCNFNALKYYSLLDSNLTALKDIFQKQSKSLTKS